MGKTKKFQYVWPKDGPKGKSGYRGFFGRFGNVLTGKGPDIFLQRQGSKTPIKPELWGNWNSYHDQNAHGMEEIHGDMNPFYNSSRGYKRYDPHTRRYKKWAAPHDWPNVGVDGNGVFPGGDGYTRFTEKEARRIRRMLHQGKRVNPARMGSEWNNMGPKRFRPEHDWFWQEAHRLGENYREGVPHWFGPNPNLSMAQQWPQDLAWWLRREM